MLTIISNPAATAFSRNPVRYRFRATDSEGMPYGLKGVRANITAQDGFAINDSFTIDWTEPDGTTGSVTFTAVVSPSTNTQIYAEFGGMGTVLDVYIANAAIIQAHPSIAPFFKLYAVETVSEIQLWIEALEPDNDWEVAFDNTNVVGIISGTNTFPDLLDTTPAGYRILLDVFFEESYNSGIFVKAGEFSSKPDTTGYVNFDLSDTLDALCRDTFAELPIPAFSDNVPVLADIFRRYYIRYREDYNTLTTPSWTTDTTRRVLTGGIAQSLFSNYDFLAALDADNSLLTWYPDRKTISTDQPEWLAWYNYTGDTKQIVLQYIRQTASAALTTLYAFDGDLIEVPDGDVLLIPVGYDQLDINNTSVQKYTVRVVDYDSDWEGVSPAYLSQARSFYVDHCEYRELRYLMYLNSFSCPATLRCIGEYVEDIEIDRLKSERILDIDFTSATPETVQFKEIWNKVFTYRSGPLTRYETDALSELLIYNFAWQVFAEGYIPLDLAGSKFNIRDTQGFLKVLEIPAQPRLKPKNYSNIMIPLTETQDGWLTDLGEFWQTALGLPWETP